MSVGRPHQFHLLTLLTSEKDLDAPQVDPLSGKTCDFPAQVQLPIAIDPGPIAADPGDLEQPKPLPIPKGLLMHTELLGYFFDSEDHRGFLSRKVDNVPLSLVIAPL
jgi:hypothetical protein